MAKAPTTVAQFLANLPAERRALVEEVRRVVNANRDPELEEGIQYGMLAWYVPHTRYPAGYHCDPKQPLPFASIGSPKGHVGIHLFCVYGNAADTEQLRAEWTASGRTLDMGAACVRVKRLDDVPLDVLGRAIKRLSVARVTAHYEASVPAAAARAAKVRAAAGGAGEPAAKPATRGAVKGAATKAVAAKGAKKVSKTAAAKATKTAAAAKRATRSTESGVKKATRKVAAKKVAARGAQKRR